MKVFLRPQSVSSSLLSSHISVCPGPSVLFSNHPPAQTFPPFPGLTHPTIHLGCVPLRQNVPKHSLRSNTPTTKLFMPEKDLVMRSMTKISYCPPASSPAPHSLISHSSFIPVSFICSLPVHSVMLLCELCLFFLAFLSVFCLFWSSLCIFFWTLDCPLIL